MRRVSAGQAAAILLALVALAALLQWSRFPFRWNQITLAYGAYIAEWRHAVSTGPWYASVSTWVGLHPPTYAWLLEGLLRAGAPPAVWHAASGLFSVASVFVVGLLAFRGLGARGAALVAAAVYAVSPQRSAYGLEILNYPLMMLAVALQMAAFARWIAKPGRAESVLLGLCTLALAWVHVLALAVPLSQLLTLLWLRRSAVPAFLRVSGLAALGALPLIPGFLEASGDPINEAAGLGAVLRHALIDLPGRYGPAVAGWVVAGLAALGALSSIRKRDLVPTSWAVQAAVSTAAIGLAMSASQASAEQFQYWVLPLAPVALLVGAAFVGREANQLLALLLVAALGANTASEVLDAGEVRALRSLVDRSHPRSALIEQWDAGALVLIQTPWFLDDDKDSIDPVFARLDAWQALDFADPGVPGMTPADPFWGQPALLEDGRWLYTFTTSKVEHLDAVVSHHLGLGQPVTVVAYGLAVDPAGRGRLRMWVGQRSFAARWTDDEVAFVVQP